MKVGLPPNAEIQMSTLPFLKRARAARPPQQQPAMLWPVTPRGLGRGAGLLGKIPAWGVWEVILREVPCQVLSEPRFPHFSTSLGGQLSALVSHSPAFGGG